MKYCTISQLTNYGSKSELINAIKKLVKQKGKINEKNLTKYLETKDIPDPDILIRTGGRKRLSNLCQISFKEQILKMLII